MSFEIYLRKNMAIGQKSKGDTGAYGQGFNYQVEAGFLREENAAQDLRSVLKAIDHRLLGLDANEIADPTTANICRWIFEKIKERNSTVAEVRLLRGDGLTASYRG